MDARLNEPLFNVITFESQVHLIINQKLADQLIIYLQNLEEIQRENWAELAHGLSKANVTNYYRSCFNDFAITEFNGVLTLALDPYSADAFSKLILNTVNDGCTPKDLFDPNFFSTFAQTIESALRDALGGLSVKHKTVPEVATGPLLDSKDQQGERPQGDFDDSVDIEDDYDGPEDCPTCGYPGCNNSCWRHFE